MRSPPPARPPGPSTIARPARQSAAPHRRPAAGSATIVRSSPDRSGSGKTGSPRMALTAPTPRKPRRSAPGLPRLRAETTPKSPAIPGRSARTVRGSRPGSARSAAPAPWPRPSAAGRWRVRLRKYPALRRRQRRASVWSTGSAPLARHRKPPPPRASPAQSFRGRSARSGTGCTRCPPRCSG